MNQTFIEKLLLWNKIASPVNKQKKRLEEKYFRIEKLALHCRNILYFTINDFYWKQKSSFFNVLL